MSPANRKLLVTSALPYANGPIHLGHLVEYVQTDKWRIANSIEYTHIILSSQHCAAVVLGIQVFSMQCLLYYFLLLSYVFTLSSI